MDNTDQFFFDCSSNNLPFTGTGFTTALTPLPDEWTRSLQDGTTNFPLQDTKIEVKTELKKAIQEKKLANGEEIPTVEWKEPAPPQPRPPEKPEEIKRRREKNKTAAMKCRQKKRDRRLSLEKKIEAQKQMNLNLTKQVEEMRKEVKMLTCCLQNHSCRLHGGLPSLNCFDMLQFAQQTVTNECVNRQEYTITLDQNNN